MPSIHDVFRQVSPRFRTARMRAFQHEFGIMPSTRVLDIGGTFDNWELLPAESLPRLTLLNLGPRPTELADEVSWSQGSALELPFGPGDFDVVFSNSVIEHVGDWGAQQQFASEVRRLNTPYWVQTPNRHFPIEPHYLGIGVQRLPRLVAKPYARVASVRGWMVEPVEESAEAMRLARKAVHLGGDDPVALCMGGYALAFVAHEFDDAAAFMDRGLAVNPNLARAWTLSGWLRVWRGESDLALEHVANAMRLSPLDPSKYGMHGAMAYAHFLASRYDMASSFAEKSMRENPNFLLAIRISAASNALAGRLEPAREGIARALECNPDLRISNLRDLAPNSTTSNHSSPNGCLPRGQGTV